jgi:hypothetical protein
VIGQSEHAVGLVLAWPESPRNFLLLSVLEHMNTKSCYLHVSIRVTALFSSVISHMYSLSTSPALHVDHFH